MMESMKTYTFDFKEIADQRAFYRDFCRQFALEEEKVHDLDSLWDAVVGKRYRCRWRLRLSICRRRSAAVSGR